MSAVFYILIGLVVLGIGGFIYSGYNSLNMKWNLRVKLYFWGVLISSMAGFTVAKVYMVWSVLFLKEHIGVPDMWYSEPLWMRINDLITRHPFVFQNIVVGIFILLGVLFIRSFFDCSLEREKKEAKKVGSREEKL